MPSAIIDAARKELEETGVLEDQPYHPYPITLTL